jgi:hypothetical protein
MARRAGERAGPLPLLPPLGRSAVRALPLPAAARGAAAAAEAPRRGCRVAERAAAPESLSEDSSCAVAVVLLLPDAAVAGTGCPAVPAPAAAGERRVSEAGSRGDPADSPSPPPAIAAGADDWWRRLGWAARGDGLARLLPSPPAASAPGEALAPPPAIRCRHDSATRRRGSSREGAPPCAAEPPAAAGDRALAPAGFAGPSAALLDTIRRRGVGDNAEEAAAAEPGVSGLMAFETIKKTTSCRGSPLYACTWTRRTQPRYVMS